MTQATLQAALAEMPAVRASTHIEAESGAYPQTLHDSLSPEMMAEADAEITSWPGYAPTPLHSLDALAEALNVAAVHYKDESGRFGLGSFKALGGAYAVMRLLSELLSDSLGKPVSPADIRAGGFKSEAAAITVVTATDGNHGRSVAWGARQAGCRCRIYIHAEVSEGRKEAMEALGAEVVRVAGNYDESVHQAAREAEEKGWYVVSDTSYPGYSRLPKQVMAGYTVMSKECIDQLCGTDEDATQSSRLPSHVFVQGGVGGLAAAVCAQMWSALGAARPRFVVVEPDRAPCLYASARAGKPTTVEIDEETIMAGLSCGEVSLLAWDILARGAADYLTIGDETVAPAMRLMASGRTVSGRTVSGRTVSGRTVLGRMTSDGAGDGGIEAGESAVAGLVGLIAACRDLELRASLDLGPESRVLLLGSEGATDPEIYASIIGKG